MTDTSTIAPLSDHAVVVNAAQDNVAVVKYGVPAGLRVRMPDGRELRVAGAVGPGHRFATADVPAGALVRQYGQPIGTSRGIKAGDPITVQNMTNDVPIVRELARRPASSGSRVFSRGDAADVPRLPAGRRARRVAQLRPDRADEHVREP